MQRDDFILPEEIAEELRIEVDAVREWCRNGVLPARYLPFPVNDYRIRRKVYEEFLGPRISQTDLYMWTRRELHRLFSQERISINPDGAIVSTKGLTGGLERLYFDWKLPVIPPVLVINLYCAETVVQSRNLYKKLDVSAFMALHAAQEWELEPHFTLRYRGTPLIGSSVFASQPVEQYCLFWQEHQHLIRKYTRACEGKRGFDEVIEILREAQLSTTVVEAEIYKHFADTGREHMYVCPGLHLKKQIEFKEVDGSLTAASIRSVLSPVVATWGEQLFPQTTEDMSLGS